MNEKKFDPKKLDKLNNPQRLLDIPIEFIWNKIHLPDPVVLVDIGAGTGFFSVPFLKDVKNGKIFACDTSDIISPGAAQPERFLSHSVKGVTP